MPARPQIQSNLTTTGTSDDEPSVSEQMAEEARAAKTRKPKGSPQLWPFAQLPRRRRADFFAPLRGLNIAALSGIDPSNVEDLGAAADLFSLLAGIEDALRVVAVPDAGVDFDEWAEKATDETLMALFQWYMDRFTPGEAKSSSN